MACSGRQPWEGKKYLGSVISDTDLGGADPKVSRHLYKAVAQAVLMFGAETWVLTPSIELALDSFQQRVAQRITGRQPRRQGDGIWE